MQIKLNKLILENFKGKDISGQRFGRLTVLCLAGRSLGHVAYWVCVCDCGEETIARGTSLRDGSIKSCGCLGRERRLESITTHGLTGGRKGAIPLYKVWINMKSRCFNANVPKFKNHGGRGIDLCAEWLDYLPFHNWAVRNGYRSGLTIERIDNDGHYCPENCRWATYAEQNINKRVNRILTFNGESLTVSQWAKRLKMKYTTLKCRINDYGWSTERALSVPVKTRAMEGSNENSPQ